MAQNVVSADSKHHAYGTAAYDAAGSAIMSFTPINQSVVPSKWADRLEPDRCLGIRIHQHLCAFHCPSHDRSTHIRSHHFCTHLRKDLHQCIVYDSDSPGARLIGIEYIVPHEVLWYSTACCAVG